MRVLHLLLFQSLVCWLSAPWLMLTQVSHKAVLQLRPRVHVSAASSSGPSGITPAALYQTRGSEADVCCQIHFYGLLMVCTLVFVQSGNVAALRIRSGCSELVPFLNRNIKILKHDQVPKVLWLGPPCKLSAFSCPGRSPHPPGGHQRPSGLWHQLIDLERQLKFSDHIADSILASQFSQRVVQLKLTLPQEGHLEEAPRLLQD